MNPPAPAEDFARRQLRQACAELERRLCAGEDGRAEDLLAAFPDLASHADSALELIYTEFVVREQMGQNPSPVEWCARFPRWGDDLGQLFQVHRAVADRDPGEPTTGFPLSVSDKGPPPLADGAGLGPPPRRVGPYELLGEIGRGGMAVVYKARHQPLGRVVALKMILAGEEAGEEEQARFRTEAEAVAGLQHPNIVQIYEVGEWQWGGTGGRSPFLSLEYVSGGNLQQKLAENLPPPREAAGLLEMLARAVHYAHGRRVLHRDLKPANVLLTDDGTPKITDFGLAKRLGAGGDDRTRTGAVVGTPPYMAPEQAGGDARQVGRAADIYALGAVLYATLTGRPPFQGSSPLDTLEQVRSREPVRPARLRPRLPRDLETICLKCLRKEPEKRYESAEALADDLRRFLAGEPIRARPTPGWERAAKWARRRPAVAALLAAVVAVAALGAGAFAWSYRQTLDALGQAERGRDHERRLREDAEAALADKTVALARQAWMTDDAEQAARLLDECPPAYRGRDWGYLDRVCRGCLLCLPVGPAKQSNPAVAWSPDGAYLATAAVADPATGGTEVALWDAGSGRKIRTFSGGDVNIGELAFTADGGRLVRAGHNYFSNDTAPTPTAVRVWNSVSGETLGEHEWQLAAPQTRLSNDGRFLALASTGGVTVWDVVNGRDVAATSAALPARITAIDVDEGGRLVAAVRGHAVDILDVTTGRAAAPRVLIAGVLRFVLFSPNGRQLAGGRYETKSDGAGSWVVTLWDKKTGREALTFPGRRESGLLCMAFSRDGGRLAAAGGRVVTVWDATTGKELLVFRGPTTFGAAAFSPDGTRLAAVSYDGFLRVFDVRPLEEPAA